MKECLNPSLAYQQYEGEVPHFLTSRDYIECSKNSHYFSHVKLLLLPCGKCPNCMENKALDWSSRLIKEAEEWPFKYFLTFTYDDSHIFIDPEKMIKRDILNKNTHKQLKRDVQLFLKRFRYDTGFNIKYYFACESGENTHRTHWHAIIFSDSCLNDLVLYGNNLYTSATIQKSWKLGLVTLTSDVNESSIAYTIGYTLKKIGEFKIQLMSNGLGLRYLNEKKEDIKFSNGFYLKNGFLVNPPSYFLRKMKDSLDPDDVKWYNDFINQERSSVKVTKTLDDLFYELITHKQTQKGKGVF